jgi:glutamate N-acetyltransferase / amino-acid N-acetyltransferase
MRTKAMDDTPMTTPQGFLFAARAGGLKKSGKLDLGLIFSVTPAACAGVFTRNKVVAAPVQVSAPRISNGLCQAVLVNSGNANACTGAQGRQDALECGRLLSEALAVPEQLVVVSSTGVIGVPLRMPVFAEQIPLLAGDLGESHAGALAKAMMTTDSFPKVSSRTIMIDDRECRLLGIAKGAGMIHPDMATMLAFVMTDACVSSRFLDQALREAVGHSFNRITVDRDTSTNDMTLILANGVIGNREIVADSPAAGAFSSALKEILLDLAKMIVRDGEGATKLVRIQVEGAVSDDDALLVARTVATSSLVKTAFFGEDANWGRIIAAAGYSGAELEPERVRILFDQIPMVEGGLGLGAEQETLATEVLKKPEFTVTIELGLGAGSAYYYTSDLTYDYVRINAAYRT